MYKGRKKRIINAAPICRGAGKGIKPYNIVDNDGDVEITMYGEVVETIPTDWWTGEPVDGLFISLSEFLEDIGRLQGSNSVTVRINSIGGDLYAGVSIYNRLKEMENVTTIVDGMAASAASLIAQAASEGNRKVYESSQIMIHGASVGLCDWYNIQQLDAVRSQLESANDSVINIYAERTGETKTKLRHMVEQTTWMTGQDAIDKGFADEIISGSVNMSMTMDKKLFYCNGIPMNVKKLFSIPGNVQMIPQKSANSGMPDADKNENGGKNMTPEELRAQYPDAVKSIEEAAKKTVDIAAAVSDAVLAERQRIQEIESIEASIADKAMIQDAKFGEHPTDAKELAFAAMQKQAGLGNEFLHNMQEDAADSGCGKIQALAAGMPGNEESEKDAADIKIAVDIANQMRGGK